MYFKRRYYLCEGAGSTGPGSHGVPGDPSPGGPISMSVALPTN